MVSKRVAKIAIGIAMITGLFINGVEFSESLKDIVSQKDVVNVQVIGRLDLKDFGKRKAERDL